MDNCTIYLDDYKSENTELWSEYFQSELGSKRKLPEKFHYFYRKLYSQSSTSFLFLSLRYDDESDQFRLRINGSIKKWYFNGNTVDNLSRHQLKECISNLSEKLGISVTQLLKARITKLESGITIGLNFSLVEIIDSLIWFKDFQRIKYADSTLYFIGKFYTLILYDKSAEINFKNKQTRKRDKEILNNQKNANYLRFEIKVNSVSGVSFYKQYASSFEKILANWNSILNELNKCFAKIQFADLSNMDENLEKMTFSEFKKYLFRLCISTLSPEFTICLFNKINCGTNKTKFRNELFDLMTSSNSEKKRLLLQLQSSLNLNIRQLTYNKINSYYNNTNIIVDNLNKIPNSIK